MTTHLSDEQIGDLVDGTLPPDALAVAAAHCAECAACAAEVEGMQQLVTLTRELGGVTPPAQLWPMVAAGTVFARDVRRVMLARLRIPLIAAATLLVVATTLIVNRIDARIARTADVTMRARSDVATIPQPLSPTRSALPPNDSAFHLARERALLEALSPKGRFVLAAAESLAVLDGAIARARHGHSPAEGARYLALLEARHFYVREVMRALGENVDDLPDQARQP